MKRNIIKIDETKCNGCGLCVPDCPEGALQIIDNKARLVSDLFCDGLGACLGTCPQGAISIEERDAEPYDERKVMENIILQGPNVIKAHLSHLQSHNETELLEQAISVLKDKNIPVPEGIGNHAGKSVPELNHNHIQGHSQGHSHGQDHGHGHGHGHGGHGCPGAAAMDLRKPAAHTAATSHKMESALQNWPVQLQLLNPQAPYLKNANLLVTADCVPFAFPNFHERFLQGKIMVTFCPKLDPTIDLYIEKLAVIFKENNIQSVTVIHMEVRCCSGTLTIVQRALEKAQKILPVKEYTIAISGEIV